MSGGVFSFAAQAGHILFFCTAETNLCEAGSETEDMQKRKKHPMGAFSTIKR